MARRRGEPSRLDQASYRGYVAVAFTACTADRRVTLANATAFNLVRDALTTACGRYECTVPVYTLMPDHLHVLVVGGSEGAETRKVMDYLKWRTASDRLHPIAWQKSFYDHVVRASEGWRNQARYIALNPVRAGLAEEPEHWPFTGSIGYELRDILGDAFW
jgi:putative transposase